MSEKEELQSRLREIVKQEQQEVEEKRKQDNYKKFKTRIDDWVIGKAHADIGLHMIDGHWRESRKTIGDTISIHGNMGDSYNSQARVTNSTYTFFHNFWTHNQRFQFQQKLNKVALEEIKKIVNTLPQLLDFLQYSLSDYSLKQLYPEDKVEEIKNEIWNETCKLLDKYSDDDFLKLIVLKKGWFDGETKVPIPPFYDFDCRNRNVLFKYIVEKRKKLISEFKRASSFEAYLEKVKKCR